MNLNKKLKIKNNNNECLIEDKLYSNRKMNELKTNEKELKGFIRKKMLEVFILTSNTIKNKASWTESEIEKY